MQILKFICHWGGSVVMAAAFLIGIPGSFSATKEFVNWASPWGVQPIHFAFMLLAVGSLYTTIVQGIRIKRLESSLPNIVVTPKVYENKAILEICNTGGEADFTATACVIATYPSDSIYRMCWESIGDNRYHIDGSGGKANLMVAEKAKENYHLDGQEYSILKNWLALYKVGDSGVERFHTFSGARWKRVENDKEVLGGTALARCIVELTITSTPKLKKKWDRRKYLLEVDNKDGMLKFEETDLLTPDKEIIRPNNLK